MPPLENQRHERFAQELAKGKSATEAYSAAGYEPSRSAACRLSTNVNVLTRAEELKERTAIRTEVTAASLIAEAEEIRRAAFAAKQYGAALLAVKEKGVLSGHRVEKSERKNVSDANQLTLDEIRAELAAMDAQAELAGADARSGRYQGKPN